MTKARLYMTGLGQYAAKLNGKPVGDAVLEPGQTSYFAEVDYRTYDVTSLLKQGAQPARRRDRQRRLPARHHGGPLLLPEQPRAGLRIAQGDRASSTSPTPTAPSRRSTCDTSWRPSSAATTFSSWWSGEDYDARRQPTDWTADVDAQRLRLA